MLFFFGLKVKEMQNKNVQLYDRRRKKERYGSHKSVA